MKDSVSWSTTDVYHVFCYIHLFNSTLVILVIPEYHQVKICPLHFIYDLQTF